MFDAAMPVITIRKQRAAIACKIGRNLFGKVLFGALRNQIRRNKNGKDENDGQSLHTYTSNES